MHAHEYTHPHTNAYTHTPTHIVKSIGSPVPTSECTSFSISISKEEQSNSRAFFLDHVPLKNTAHAREFVIIESESDKP
jgi:hypothetical protein